MARNVTEGTLAVLPVKPWDSMMGLWAVILIAHMTVVVALNVVMGFVNQGKTATLAPPTVLLKKQVEGTTGIAVVTESVKDLRKAFVPLIALLCLSVVMGSVN